MFGYIAKRFAGLFPFVLFVIVLNFTLIQLAPGDAISFLISDANVNPEYLELAKIDYQINNNLFKKIRSDIFTIIFLALLFVTLIFYFFSKEIIALFAFGFDQQTSEVYSQLLKNMSPFLFLSLINI